MKYIPLILGFISYSFQAQAKIDVKESKNPKVLDTLYYLKTNFELRKSEYIGKPFSYLLSKMVKIQPKTVWNTTESTEDSIDKSIFRFYDMNYPIMNETKMMITWQTGLSYRLVDSYSRRNKYYFTIAERKLYGSKIIKDILVYR